MNTGCAFSCYSEWLLFRLVTDTSGGLLNGRYRLIEPVGAGGMGRVWRGHDELLRREVAIKELTLPPAMGAGQRQTFIRRAIREARAAARLTHPGIITIYDVITYNETPVIVMEFVEGPSLEQVISREGRLDALRVARIGVTMLEALQEAHAAGIVHRDLKPANVLLAGRRVVITDFGIARLTDDHTLTPLGSPLGTPAFMAPEQAHGMPVTAAWDLWSLGATLYAAVEGRPPYQGSDFLAVLSALLTQDPPPPVHAGPLAPVLAGLLRKDPARRLTAAQALQELSAVLDRAAPRPPAPQPQAPAPAAPRTRRRRRFPSRRRVLLGGLGALALGAPAALLARELLPDPAPEPTPTAAPVPGRRARHWAPAGVLRGHSDLVHSVAFSPDGTLLVAAGADTTIRIWEMPGGKPLGVLRARSAGYPEALAFSPDGTMLAAGNSDSTIRLWNPLTRKHIDVLTGHTGPVRAVAFHPDGTVLASGGDDNTVRLWDPATGKPIALLEGHTGDVRAMAFSPNGALLATGGTDDTVRLWDLDTRKSSVLTGHEHDVDTVAFSPNGALLATGSQDDTVRLWDVRTRKTIAVLTEHTDDVYAVAFSPNGALLATGSWDDTVRLWDVRTKKPTAVLTEHTDDVRSVAFHPDGILLATAGSDLIVRLWRPA